MPRNPRCRLLGLIRLQELARRPRRVGGMDWEDATLGELLASLSGPAACRSSKAALSASEMGQTGRISRAAPPTQLGADLDRLFAELEMAALAVHSQIALATHSGR